MEPGPDVVVARHAKTLACDEEGHVSVDSVYDCRLAVV